MPTIPRAICIPCGLAYHVKKNGVRAVNRLADGDAYFTVQSDRAACEGCGHEVLIGFALSAEWERHEGEETRYRGENDVYFHSSIEDRKVPA